MAIQVTNTLTAIITSTEDSTGNVFTNRGNGNPAIDATLGQYTQQFKCGLLGVDTAIPFPVGVEIDQLYIKNNDAVAVLTVKWVAAGGGTGLIRLQPGGGQIMIWEPVIGGGVATVTIASSVNNTFAEIFIGAI